MFSFEHIEYLWALTAIPLMIVIYIVVMSVKKRRLQKLGDFNLLLQMMPDVSVTKQTVKFVFYSIALFFLILGIANLQTGSKMQEVKREGADIMVCLDVSNSMLAEDLKPNRLERA